MITSILIAALLGSASFGSVDVEKPGVEFSYVRDSLVVIPVFLNGHGTYRFLLDTGATHSILSSRVANELNITAGRSPIPINTKSIITAGGSVSVTIRTIEVVQIGDVNIMQAQIAVADFELLRTLKIDGIIGADYLKQFIVSIDYAHHVLHIRR
jgi:predicted aspartyl protease